MVQAPPETHLVEVEAIIRQVASNQKFITEKIKADGLSLVGSFSSVKPRFYSIH